MELTVCNANCTLSNQDTVEKLEDSLSEQKTENDVLTKQLEVSNDSAADLQKQYESQGVSMQQLEQDVAQKTSEIKCVFVFCVL